MIIYAAVGQFSGVRWSTKFSLRPPQPHFANDGVWFPKTDSFIAEMWSFEKLFPKLNLPVGISKFEIDEKDGVYTIRRVEP